jgi:thiamine pyrophosphokinase
VLAGGDPVDPSLRRWLPDEAFVVAADSGLHLSAPLGLHVDCIVGDFDSADPALVDAAVAAGATVERHPADKGATDLELALLVAQRAGAARVVVAGGAGGRLDHFLANVALLAHPRFAPIAISALLAGARITVVRGDGTPVALDGNPGDLVTLLPVGGDARDVTTHGLQYPLHGETLGAGTTRGVSNVLVGPSASVQLGAGTLLVVQPLGGER